MEWYVNTEKIKIENLLNDVKLDDGVLNKFTAQTVNVQKEKKANIFSMYLASFYF